MGDVSCRYLKSYFDTCIAQGCPPEPLIELLNPGPAPFENPAPSRRIGIAWRRGSGRREEAEAVAAVLKETLSEIETAA